MNSTFEKILKSFNLTPDGYYKIETNFFDPENVSLDYGVYEGGRWKFETDNQTAIRLTASFDENENKIIHEDIFKVVTRDDIVLVLNIESDEDKAFYLARSFDHYTGAIDNGSDYRRANEQNSEVLKDLITMGVPSVTWLNHTPMMSSNASDKEFILTEKSKVTQ